MVIVVGITDSKKLANTIKDLIRLADEENWSIFKEKRSLLRTLLSKEIDEYVIIPDKVYDKLNNEINNPKIREHLFNNVNNLRTTKYICQEIEGYLDSSIINKMQNLIKKMQGNTKCVFWATGEEVVDEIF
ncbi:MAG: hypothetical protein ACOCRK_09090 [bacterium]